MAADWSRLSVDIVVVLLLVLVLVMLRMCVYDTQNESAGKGGPLCPLPGGYRRIHGVVDDLTYKLQRYTHGPSLRPNNHNGSEHSLSSSSSLIDTTVTNSQVC